MTTLPVARFCCRHPTCAKKPPAENDHSIATIYEHVGQHLMFDTGSNDHLNLVCSCSQDFCFMGTPYAVDHLDKVRQDQHQHHMIHCRRISLADIHTSSNMLAYFKRFVAFGGYREEEDRSHHLPVHPVLVTEDMQISPYQQHGFAHRPGSMMDHQQGRTSQFAPLPGEYAPVMDSNRDMRGHPHYNMTRPPVIGYSNAVHHAGPTMYGQNTTVSNDRSYGSFAAPVNGFAPAAPMAAAHIVASQMSLNNEANSAPGIRPEVQIENRTPHHRAPSPNARTPVYNNRSPSPPPSINSNAADREMAVNYGRRTPFPARRGAAAQRGRFGAVRDVVERVDLDADSSNDFEHNRNSAVKETRKRIVSGSSAIPLGDEAGPSTRRQRLAIFSEQDGQRQTRSTHPRPLAFDDELMGDTRLLRQRRAREAEPKKDTMGDISDRSE